MTEKTKPVLCILGPTSSGKTALSIGLAERFQNVEIVSADSLAVYRYLDIGTAKPPLEVRQRIPHHLIDFLDPRERWSAYEFRREALRLFREISLRGRLPVVVGGTAFYLNTLFHGIPGWGAPQDRNLRRVLERIPTEKLYALLVSVDPHRARKIGKKDRKRLIRALEIFLLTLRMPSEKRTPSQRPWTSQYLLVGISWSKEKLRERIRERVEEMFRQGIVEEVQRLFERGYRPPIPALENFTYRPVVDFLEGRCSLATAKEEIVRGTLTFVKRQMNWFRKMPITWFSPEDGNLLKLAEEVYHFVRVHLEGG